MTVLPIKPTTPASIYTPSELWSSTAQSRCGQQRAQIVPVATVAVEGLGEAAAAATAAPLGTQDRETANQAPPPDHQTTEPRSQNVILVGWQSVRPWSSFLSLRTVVRACPCVEEPCYHLLLANTTPRRGERGTVQCR
jgi:hypothetical protein